MTTPHLAPGVRVTEFSPGGPITGVGTNTAAFVGTALTGPPGEPTLVLSWEAFTSEFGDGGLVPSPSRWFARAVYGFFANGGTAAYILRVSSGVQAQADLPSRQGGAHPEPALKVAAAAEGAAGNGLQVEVTESSLLADRLQAAGAPAGTSTLPVVTRETTISAVSAGARCSRVGLRLTASPRATRYRYARPGSRHEKRRSRRSTARERCGCRPLSALATTRTGRCGSSSCPRAPVSSPSTCPAAFASRTACPPAP